MRLDADVSESESREELQEVTATPALDLPEHRFNRLLKFYKTQLADSDTAANNPFGVDASYSSPSNLARIMQLYGGLSASSLKKAREKPQPMREALNQAEGLALVSDENSAIAQIRDAASTIPTEDLLQTHPWNSSAKTNTTLWPVPTLLTTRRAKRCRTCRHILIRHEDRKHSSSTQSASSSVATSLKYKIRLLAQSFIPTLSLRPFLPAVSASMPQPRTAFALTTQSLAALQDPSTCTLRPGVRKNLLLLVSNPLFETVRINLATPAITPGKVQSTVTILCPSFEIGADGDVWDAALNESSSSLGSKGKDKRELLGGNGQRGSKGDGEGVPEAGKVWERGRNWVGVVVEVVPGMLARTSEAKDGEREKEDGEEDYEEWSKREKDRRRERTINDDVLEIPVFVRAEWEADVTSDDGPAGAKGMKEKRELAFWCVLGVGKYALGAK
ncbi:hypothetical protein CAC42_5540 [Sphaceloma murrayae]|uniref:Dynactin subunit 4 n=1 Tax=Sphaceloma murrayae TaxID=2082308 RepID=A0A2K1QYM0_9PEZI|nr:hypothetical protein CAC42_5540 [Sphaceloma murrayae]